MERCKNHRKYKGLNKPQCGGYDGPCEACLTKYKKVQEDFKINQERDDKEYHGKIIGWTPSIW